jgi:transposase, IS5 family
MGPQKINNQELDFFMMPLKDFIDLKHPLCLVADDLDWGMLETELSKFYCEDEGRPGKPIRLMVGLLYLKSVQDLSDEEVLGGLTENPYWQYFCGFTHFRKRIDLDSSSLTRFRKRIGERGLDLLNKAILDRAVDHKYLKSQQLKRVNIDTTVMSKDIKYPTDVDLYCDMLRVLVRKARACGIELRQSYKRAAKRELLRSKRARHGRRIKEALRHQRKLRTYLGRVTREIERKLETADEEWEKLLLLSERISNQTKDSKDKVYSIFEPQVYCVNKGKSSPRYEFGCKVAIASTIKDSWVVGVHTMLKNEYDSKALEPVLANMGILTGKLPDHAVVDRGFRGRTTIGETEVILPKPKRSLSKKIFKWVKQRSRIEAVISHLKNDHRMGRNLLKGIIGDLLNPKLAMIGWNLKKLMRKLLFVLKILSRILTIEIEHLKINLFLQSAGCR